MPRTKEEVITFKVDASLAGAMKGIPNRSQFIRGAILAALDSVCPVCMGTGVLTIHQRRHWDDFAHQHRFEECPDCHVKHLISCRKGHVRPKAPVAKAASRRKTP